LSGSTTNKQTARFWEQQQVSCISHWYRIGQSFILRRMIEVTSLLCDFLIEVSCSFLTLREKSALSSGIK